MYTGGIAMELDIRPLWDTRQTAKRIGFPSGKALDIARLRGSIDLPHIKIGKRVKYEPETVEQWLRDKTVIPGQEKDAVKKDQPAPRAKRRRQRGM
jgi:hypothetical protein